MKFADRQSTLSHLDALQGVGEKQTEPYMEIRRRSIGVQQHGDAPKAISATGSAGRQDGGVEVWR